jgi:hypothetical protein
VTSRQYDTRQRAVWRTSLATGRHDKSPKTRRLALCPVVATTNTTHKRQRRSKSATIVNNILDLLLNGVRNANLPDNFVPKNNPIRSMDLKSEFVEIVYCIVKRTLTHFCFYKKNIYNDMRKLHKPRMLSL